MAYSLETRQKARDLFVEQGLSYEEVARQTGVSVNNLKKWGSEEKWTKQRDEYQREFAQFHAKIGKLKLKLVNEALDTGEPQKIYALSGLMRASGNGEAIGGAEDRIAVCGECLADLSDYVEEKDPEAFKSFKLFIRDFFKRIKGGALESPKQRVKTAAEKIEKIGATGGLDPETLRKIREEVYGIVEAGN